MPDGGYNVGYIEAGESLRYTVDVTKKSEARIEKVAILVHASHGRVVCKRRMVQASAKSYGHCKTQDCRSFKRFPSSSSLSCNIHRLRLSRVLRHWPVIMRAHTFLSVAHIVFRVTRPVGSRLPIGSGTSGERK